MIWIGLTGSKVEKARQRVGRQQAGPTREFFHLIVRRKGQRAVAVQ